METGNSNSHYFNSNTIQVNSLNINGLKKKLVKTTDFMKQNNIDILLLQEIHLINEKLVTDYMKQNNFLIYINKTLNQHNNYNGTAFVLSNKICSTYNIAT